MHWQRHGNSALIHGPAPPPFFLPICRIAAPEQIIGHRCTLAADLYSFALLLIQLATQQAVVRHRGDWRLPRAPDECPQVGAVPPALHSPSRQHWLPTQPCRDVPRYSHPSSRTHQHQPFLCSSMSLTTCMCLQAVVDLIEECISSDPQRRPSAAQALQRLRSMEPLAGGQRRQL